MCVTNDRFLGKVPIFGRNYNRRVSFLQANDARLSASGEGDFEMDKMNEISPDKDILYWSVVGDVSLSSDYRTTPCTIARVDPHRSRFLAQFDRTFPTTDFRQSQI